jgi:drug/metabolite transporter (DMT)-like permease
LREIFKLLWSKIQKLYLFCFKKISQFCSVFTDLMTKQAKAYISLAFICVVWGTTYLAIRVGVLHYPAFLFAGVRQTIAGIILTLGALAVNRDKDLSKQNLLRQMLVGFLMLTLGNGLVSWGEKYVPSGIAAMVCSMMPLFAVLFNLLLSKKEHFNSTIGTGMLLGACGVGLIFRHNLADLTGTAYLGGIFAVLFATASWAMGSIVNKRHTSPVNPFFNSGLQLLSGGIFMLILSPVVDNYQGMQLWNTEGILALAYLIVFGSVLAYAAYMYELSILPVGIATLYAYINPMIAVIFGYLFLNEGMNIYTALAFGTIVASVYLVNMGYRKQHKTDLENAAIKTADAFPESVPKKS